MRFVLRFMSLALLVVAVIAGVVDAIQSVAAGRPEMTPLGLAWSEASPDTLELARTFVESRAPYLWDPVIGWVLLQPAVAVLLALSLVFYLIGYRRPHPAGRFAA
jgi:hypothetical protein